MQKSFGKSIKMSFSWGSQLVKEPPSLHGVPFGTVFAPAMFEVDWTEKAGWGQPEIRQYGALSIPPAASGLHYGLQCFEGMKAYHGQKGEIRLFRPEMNARRLQRSMKRLVFPSFDEDDFMYGLKELVAVNKTWIPKEKGYSLYIRPTAIGNNTNLGVGPADSVKLFIITSPVGPYYPNGFKPVKLLVSTKYKRAWPGGTGEFKLGANYAGPILPQKAAAQEGFQQILWLGPGDVCDEVGAMNFMVLWKNKAGERELITAPIDGTILPGVTRDSILTLARQWGEFAVKEERFTIHELIDALKENRVEEMFGCGTAAIVTQVEGLQVRENYYKVPIPEKSTTQRILNAIQDIQYGVVEHEWSKVIIE